MQWISVFELRQLPAQPRPTVMFRGALRGRGQSDGAGGEAGWRSEGGGAGSRTHLAPPPLPVGMVVNITVRRIRQDLGLGLGGILGALLGRGRGGDLGVLELGALLAVEHGAAVGEGSGLVGLLGQLALGVGHGQGAAVLDQLEQTPGLVTVGGHAGGPAAEGGQLPGVAGLDGGAARRGEAHAGEVSEDVGGNEAAEGLGSLAVGGLLLVGGVHRHQRHGDHNGDESLHDDCRLVR